MGSATAKIENLNGINTATPERVGGPDKAPAKAPAPRPQPKAQPVPPASDVDIYAAPRFSALSFVSYAVVAVALYLGWRASFDEYIIAEEGLGYYLGIVGGSMMLLLLLYPLRKKTKFMRRLGATRHWFRMHMVFGVLGPVLVTFHSNFSLGSTNSNIALVSTMLVAGSGFVGRYIYAKIHYGLYGRKKSFADLKRELAEKEHTLAVVLGYAPTLQKRLVAFDAKVLKPRVTFINSFIHYIIIGPVASYTTIRLRLSLRKVLVVAAKRGSWSAAEKKRRAKEAREHISEHISTALMISEFSVYERLFALWHLLHFPLFILLIVVAVAHVLAVHLY